MLSRRNFVVAGATGATLGGASLFYFSRSENAHPYRVRFSGTVDTDEPIVSGTDVRTSGTYPFQYATVIRTAEQAKKRFRIDYLRNQVPVDVSDYVRAEYPDEFHLIAGIVLPNTRQIDQIALELRDGTLYPTYRVTTADSAPTGPVVHNSVQRIKRADAAAPDRVVPRYQFEDGTRGDNQ